MKTVYLDTETNDKEPGQICQMTYIVEENNIIIKRVNQYLKVSYMEPGASKATGLTVELLDRLSEGKVFADRAQEFYNDLNGSLVIAHNVAFDEKFVSAEMARLGVSMWFKPKLCTMNFFTNILKLPGRYGKYKWPRLEEVAQFLGVEQEDIYTFARSLFGNTVIGAHDARYDTSALYLIVKKAVQLNAIDLNKIDVSTSEIVI